MAKTINYGPTISTPDGVIYSAQTSAGRTSKAWVIVRYRDLADAGEIIHEDGAVIERLWWSPKGHLHAMCRKGFHHTNESGAWKKTRVKKGNQSGYLVWGHGDRLFLGVDDELYERRDGTYELSLAGPSGRVTDFASAMDAAGGALYVSRCDGTVHRFVERWEPVKLPRRVGPNAVVCAGDDLYISTRIGLYRRRGGADVVQVSETPLQYGTPYAGQVIAANYSGGVYRVEGDSLHRFGEGFSVTQLDGSGAYLCATGMAPEIQIFDGNRWIQKT